MRVTVKICGLTSAADSRAAIAAGADYLGFVFFPASRRCVQPADLAWIRDLSGAHKVGVFRDQAPAEVARLRDEAGLDLEQLHGHESGGECDALGGVERVIKAVPVAGAVDWGEVARWARSARIVFDTPSPSGGGTGRTFDWSTLTTRPFALDFWLAGGLRPDNVAAAIEQVHPCGVDVASGVEVEMGRKDAATMRAFIGAVRAAAVKREGGERGERSGAGTGVDPTSPAGGTEGMR